MLAPHAPSITRQRMRKREGYLCFGRPLSEVHAFSCSSFHLRNDSKLPLVPFLLMEFQKHSGANRYQKSPLHVLQVGCGSWTLSELLLRSLALNMNCSLLRVALHMRTTLLSGISFKHNERSNQKPKILRVVAENLVLAARGPRS